MAFVPTGDGARACINFTLNTVEVQICLKFTKATPTPADYQILADQVATRFGTNMMPSLSQFLTFRNVEVTPLASQTLPVYTSLINSGLVGGASGDSLTNTASLNMQYTTDGRGRSSRGRSFVPGVPESQVTEGVLPTANANAYVTAFSAFIDQVEDSSDWTQAVISEISNGAPRTEGLVQPVQSISLPTRVGVQRRRQRPA